MSKFTIPHLTRRGYATRPGGSRLKPTLSLDQFIQRGRVLAFYRTILRGTKKIADPTTRAESRKYARDEFERRRNVTDASHVRYLLSVGKTEWEGMERYIDVPALSSFSQVPENVYSRLLAERIAQCFVRSIMRNASRRPV
ncbi:hypothetical protein ACJA88_004052 [Fusarium oxysporum]